MKWIAKYLIILQSICFLSYAADFVEKIPVYGIIKPKSITTMLAINNGMVNQIQKQIGDKVVFGETIISVIEKETIRSYKSSIQGSVAKIHNISNGSLVTPGMPLVTILNPNEKIIEIALAPHEAKYAKEGSLLEFRGKSLAFGKLLKVSPLVDPDSGTVLSFAVANGPLAELIGDVIPLNLTLRTITDCEVVKISEVDKYIKDFDVVSTSGVEACLKKK